MENALKMLKNMFAELTIGPWGPGCPGGPRIPWGPWKNMDDLIALLVDVIRKKMKLWPILIALPVLLADRSVLLLLWVQRVPEETTKWPLEIIILRWLVPFHQYAHFPSCSLYISLGTNKEKYWKNFFSWRSFPFSLIISGDTSHSYGFQA